VTPEEVDNCTQKLFSLPSSFPISHCKGYLKGNLLAIDKSSVYAVEALGIKPGNIVLDLCCAPGMKLACIADLVGDQGFVVGVVIFSVLYSFHYIHIFVEYRIFHHID
jgi:16S rRNA C967 or C1407 C5-methylase (RsmB/RsmF family)